MLGQTQQTPFPTVALLAVGTGISLALLNSFLVSNNVVCALAPEKSGLSLVEGADVGAGPSSP